MQFKYGGTFAPLEFGRKLREMYVAQDVDGDVIGIPAREFFFFHLIGRGGKGTGLGRYEDGIAGPILGKTHVRKRNVISHLIVVPDGLQFGQFREKGNRVDGFLERNSLRLDRYGLVFLVAGNAGRQTEKGAGGAIDYSLHVSFQFGNTKLVIPFISPNLIRNKSSLSRAQRIFKKIKNFLAESKIMTTFAIPFGRTAKTRNGRLVSSVGRAQHF